MSKGSEYKLTQIFGYKGPNEKVQNEDIISTIKFNSNGDLLALGDNAGRIILFQTNKKSNMKNNYFNYYAEFQAHLQKFDCLRSQSVSESVKDICWLTSQNKYDKLLSTNSNTIKLWKLFQKPQRRAIWQLKGIGSNELSVPTLQTIDSSFVAKVQTTLPSKHHSQIHTISNSHNQQYLLSFDDVQCFMWNLQRPEQPYVVLDYLKGKQLDDVKQNISCGKFHPTSDSILVYGTNKTTLKIHDLRVSMNQIQNGTQFKSQNKQNKNFFTNLLTNYTSVDFLKNGRFIVARDFLTVKVWDVCQNKKPVLQVTLQENYKQKLCEMYEHDCIDDRFQVTGSTDGSSIITGNYNNNFHVVDILDGKNNQYELSYKKQTLKKQILAGKMTKLGRMDYKRKINVLDFNRMNNMFAVVSENCFFIYSQ